MVSSSGSPTVRRRRLGAQLRELRQNSHTSVEQVAQAFDVTPSTIYRMELGRVKVKTRDIDLFAKLYGVDHDSGLVKELTGLARDGSKRGWWAKYADTISPPYATYIGLEAEATRLSIYDGLIINGLLQTREYAQSTFDFVDENAKANMEKRIELRMERQGRVRQRELQMWNVIDEAAIRRVIGGAPVMRQQLRHLLEVADLPNVQIQVLPFAGGAYPGMLGSFTFMEFGPGGDPKDPDPEPDPTYRHPDVVYIEGHTGDVYEEEHTDRFKTVFENLRVAALSPTMSLELIRKEIDRLG
ncbi:helix-turn-helix transcriptional regulator [Stackebrandtia albiflava]|uniref:helix-turn-helix domain-containing protein n=1 Tax=Stackebrandtia albiflava TaxID=406432 RepID=UPI0031E8BFBB